MTDPGLEALVIILTGFTLVGALYMFVLSTNRQQRIIRGALAMALAAGTVAQLGSAPLLDLALRGAGAFLVAWGVQYARDSRRQDR